MTEPMKVRWLYSDADERAHVLDENDTVALAFVVTVCQQVFPDTVPVYQTVPSMNVCTRCGLYAAVPQAEHATRPKPMLP